MLDIQPVAVTGPASVYKTVQTFLLYYDALIFVEGLLGNKKKIVSTLKFKMT